MILEPKFGTYRKIQEFYVDFKLTSLFVKAVTHETTSLSMKANISLILHAYSFKANVNFIDDK